MAGHVSDFIAEGLLEDRPAATTAIMGMLYRSTDETPPVVYRCNGSGWTEFSSSADPETLMRLDEIEGDIEALETAVEVLDDAEVETIATQSNKASLAYIMNYELEYAAELFSPLGSGLSGLPHNVTLELSKSGYRVDGLLRVTLRPDNDGEPEVWANIPENERIYTQAIGASALTGSQVAYDLPFLSSVELDPGTTYWLAVESHSWFGEYPVDYWGYEDYIMLAARYYGSSPYDAMRVEYGALDTFDWSWYNPYFILRAKPSADKPILEYTPPDDRLWEEPAPRALPAAIDQLSNALPDLKRRLDYIEAHTSGREMTFGYPGKHTSQITLSGHSDHYSWIDFAFTCEEPFVFNTYRIYGRRKAGSPAGNAYIHVERANGEPLANILLTSFSTGLFPDDGYAWVEIPVAYDEYNPPIAHELERNAYVLRIFCTANGDNNSYGLEIGLDDTQQPFGTRTRRTTNAFVETLLPTTIPLIELVRRDPPDARLLVTDANDVTINTDHVTFGDHLVITEQEPTFELPQSRLSSAKVELDLHEIFNLILTDETGTELLFDDDGNVLIGGI